MKGSSFLACGSAQHAVILLPGPRHAVRGRLSSPTPRSTCQAPPHVLMLLTQAVGIKSCRPRSGLLTWHPSASTADSLLCTTHVLFRRYPFYWPHFQESILLSDLMYIRGSMLLTNLDFFRRASSLLTSPGLDSRQSLHQASTSDREDRIKGIYENVSPRSLYGLSSFSTAPHPPTCIHSALSLPPFSLLPFTTFIYHPSFVSHSSSFLPDSF